MKEKRLLFIGILSLLFFVVLYLLKFNEGLSANSQEWSDFASYLSGLMMIVLTSINIYVFIKLTKAIDMNDDERRKQEVKVQKLILLSNFKQDEINQFNNVLNNALMIKPSFSIDEASRSIVEATTYIETFINTKKHIFPNIEEESFVIKIVGLHKLLGLLYKKWKDSFSTISGTEKNDFNPLVFQKEDIEDFLKLKNNVLSSLQEYTIMNLEY